MTYFRRFGHFPKAISRLHGAISARFPWKRVTSKEAASDDPHLEETYIKDSNVEIIIANGQSQLASGIRKDTDYLSFGIIVIVMIAIASYAFMVKYGVLTRIHIF